MMNESIEDVLVDSIEEMYNILKSVNKKDFDIEKAKLKILANNSLNASAKTLLQYQIVENHLHKSMANTSSNLDRMIGE